MHPEVLQEYKLGDMVAKYLIDRDSMQVGFQLLPEKVSQENIITDNCFMESLIQYKLTGDIYNEAYAGGCSMRNSESVRKLKFSEQTDESIGEQLQVNTIMMDEDGHRLIHHLVWLKNMPYVRISCTFENQNKRLSAQDVRAGLAAESSSSDRTVTTSQAVASYEANFIMAVRKWI